MHDNKEIIIKPYVSSIFSTLKDIWNSKQLLSYFTIRTIHLRYKGTVLGWSWLIIRPLVPALISAMIFGEIAKIPSEGIPYLLFFYIGNGLWSLLATTLNLMTRSLRWNRKIISKLYFPRIIVPIATIGLSMVDFLVSIALFFILVIYYYFTTGKFFFNFAPTCIFSFFFILMTLFISIGIGLYTSILYTRVRDVRFTLPYVLNMWSYMTPIIYPLSLIPGKWRWFATINPMAYIIEGFKWSLLGKGEINIFSIIISSLVCCLVLFLGIWFFVKEEKRFVDNL